MRQRFLGFLFALVVCASAGAQTVVQRARLGHVLEDLDVMDKGKRVAILDGTEVFAATDKGAVEKLFDIRPAADFASGFVYIPTEKAFAILAPSHLDQWQMYDEKGAYLGPRAVTYLNGFVPGHFESGAYLGKDTPFPDHIAFLAYDANLENARLEIARRDGTVVHEAILPPPFDTLFVGGVTSAGGNRLLMTFLPSSLCVIDTDGHLLAGPVRIPEVFNMEAVTAAGERFYCADYHTGKLLALDASLQRTPAYDIASTFGIRMGNLGGVAWDSDEDRPLIIGSVDGTFGPVAGYALSPALDDVRPMFFPPAHALLAPRRMAYMPDEHRIVLANMQNPRALVIYERNGRIAQQLDVFAFGRPLHVAYIPTTHEFYVRMNEPVARLRVFARDGTFLRDVPIAATSLGAIAYANGDLLMVADGMLLRTDLDGVPIATYDPAPLGNVILSLAAITTGADAGKFVAAMARNTEVVVFSLP